MRYGLLAILLSFQASLYAQDFAYYVTLQGELFTVSLEDGSTLDRRTIPLTNAKLLDSEISGFSKIYLINQENDGPNGSDKVLYEYVIATESLIRLGKLPLSGLSRVRFEEFIGDDKISFLVSEDVFPFRFVTLNLNSFEFSPHSGFASEDGRFETFKNPVDNSSWFWQSHEFEVLAQFSPGREYRNIIDLDANTESTVGVNLRGSAFNGKGELYTMRSEGSDFNVRKYLRKVSFEDAKINDVGILEEGITTGNLHIPAAPSFDEPVVIVTPPAIGLDEQVVGLPVISMPLTVSNPGNQAFTINDASLDTEHFSIDFSEELVLNPGDQHTFNIKFTPSDETLFKDTLRIMANGVGIFKKVPLQGQIGSLFDVSALEPLKPDVLYGQTSSGVVELNDSFEEQAVIAEFCGSCFYSISPKGRLYRLDTLNQGLRLDVLDISSGEYQHLRNLDEMIESRIPDFTMDGDYTFSYIDERDILCCPPGPVSIVNVRDLQRIDFLHQRSIESVYITSTSPDKLLATHYETLTDELFVLSQRSDVFSVVDVVTDQEISRPIIPGTFGNLYFGRGRSLMALNDDGALYALDLGGGSSAKVADFTGQLIGIWHPEGNDLEIGYESLDFGEVLLDQQKSFAIRVFNQKGESVTLNEISLANNTVFTQSTSLPLTIEAGEVADLPVVFLPTEAILSEDLLTLRFTDGQGGIEKNVSLKGLGKEAEPDPDPDPDPVTSVDEEISLEQIRVFPNPASASGNLNFEGVPAGVKELKFFNTHGQLVKTYRTNRKAKFQVNISSFSTAGIMVIKFISEDSQYLGFKRVLLKR